MKGKSQTATHALEIREVASEPIIQNQPILKRQKKNEVKEVCYFIPNNDHQEGKSKRS